MTGWIIYPKYVSRHSDNAFGWLTEEASRTGIVLNVVFIEDIIITYGAEENPLRIKGVGIKTMPDFIIMRTYDSIVSRFFENHGIPVINSSVSMELCKNKMLTHERLAAASIPTPRTAYNESAEYDYDTLSEIFGSGRFIVKRIDGAKGEDVFLIDNGIALQTAVKKCHGKCICQQFIHSSYGRDVRVWTVGGSVAGAVLRRSDSSFLSNYSQGGYAEPFDLPEEGAVLAVQSALALGAEFTGVDLLFTEDGFTVNEVNGNAGFRTLSSVGDNPIPNALFRYIKETYDKIG